MFTPNSIRLHASTLRLWCFFCWGVCTAFSSTPRLTNWPVPKSFGVFPIIFSDLTKKQMHITIYIIAEIAESIYIRICAYPCTQVWVLPGPPLLS